MATLITQYLITQLAPETWEVELFGTSYWGYQVYIDNALVAESTTNPFNFGAIVNQKVDIIGIDDVESGEDFSSLLSDDDGDKVRVEVDDTYSGTLSIYSDNGTGTIDYGKRLGQVTVVGGGGHPLGWGHFSWGHSPWGHSGNTRAIFITQRQPNGTIRFSIVPVSNSKVGTPIEVSSTIATRPNQIIPSIRSYNPDTGIVTIEAIDN